MIASLAPTSRSDFPQHALMSPCYCGRCKKTLTASRILDESHAWCPHCKTIVNVACFYVPNWTIGVLLLLVIVMVN